MSFQIRDKSKINLLRKCVQILTHERESLTLHFSQTRIRLLNELPPEGIYIFDLQREWFTKFTPPEPVRNGTIDTLSISCRRDPFLQSFNAQDDQDLEFLVSFDDAGQAGKLKVIKTRDVMVIEAEVHFEVDGEAENKETYTFPTDELLINCHRRHVKNVKDIFQNKPRLEILDISFSPDSIQFKGEINRKFDYLIPTASMDSFGHYVTNGRPQYESFGINVSLRHLLGLLKICDLVEGNFMAAMELGEQPEPSTADSQLCECCSLFLFTQSYRNDFSFIVGLQGLRLTPKEGEIKRGKVAKQVQEEMKAPETPQIVRGLTHQRPVASPAKEPRDSARETAVTNLEALREDLTSVSQLKKQRFYDCVDEEDFF